LRGEVESSERHESVSTKSHIVAVFAVVATAVILTSLTIPNPQ
jgi:hypothetical protein